MGKPQESDQSIQKVFAVGLVDDFKDMIRLDLFFGNLSPFKPEIENLSGIIPLFLRLSLRKGLQAVVQQRYHPVGEIDVHAGKGANLVGDVRQLFRRRRTVIKHQTLRRFIHIVIQQVVDAEPLESASKLFHDGLVNRFEFVNGHFPGQDYKGYGKALLKGYVADYRHEMGFAVPVIAAQKADLCASLGYVFIKVVLD